MAVRWNNAPQSNLLPPRGRLFNTVLAVPQITIKLSAGDLGQYVRYAKERTITLASFGGGVSGRTAGLSWGGLLSYAARNRASAPTALMRMGNKILTWGASKQPI